MLWINLLVLSSFLVFSCHGTLSPREILRSLTANYSRDDSPGYPDKPTKVKLGAYVNNLQYLGDVSSDFLVTFYLRQRWKDPRLVFSTSDGKKSSIRLPDDGLSQIWIPDTFIRTARNVKIDSDLSSNRLLTLSSEGEVWYALKLTATIHSRFDGKNYPFNKQKLGIILESFGYKNDTVYFKSLPGGIEIDSNINLPQFTIRNTEAVDCSVNYTTGTYPCLELVLNLERNSCQLFLQFFLPSILIVTLSWLAFWLDLETSSPSRLLTGFLSLITLILLNAFGGHSKVASLYATPLNLWTIVCYFLVFGTLVEFAVVNILSKRRGDVSGLEYFKPPFAGAEKVVEANGKDATDGSGGDGKRKARLVDWFSRIFFPIAFLLFNLIYWIKFSG